MSTVTQFLNQLILENSAKTTATVGSHTDRSRTGPILNREIGASRTLPDNNEFVSPTVSAIVSIARNLYKKKRFLLYSFVPAFCSILNHKIIEISDHAYSPSPCARIIICISTAFVV